MPRLLVFAPCQKVVVDQIDTSISLISIINGLTVAATVGGEPIPDNAAIPLQWAAVSIWYFLPGEEGRTFEQRIEIVAPDAQRFGTDATVQFTMTQRTHQVYVIGAAFPVGVPGEYQIALSVREYDQGQEWNHVTDYPIEIRRDV